MRIMMRWSSLSSLSSLLLSSWRYKLYVCFVVFCFCGVGWNGNNSVVLRMMMVEAKCRVQNRSGNDMILSTTGPLPEGMRYDPLEDLLTCETPTSCQGYTISGCRYVRCGTKQACQGAQFAHVRYLRCHGAESCADVAVSDTEMMHCGPLMTASSQSSSTSSVPNQDHFCERSHVELEHKFLNCIGPGSCHAPSWKDRMVVDVGANALVSCSLSNEKKNNHNKNEEACGNMVIEVSHGNRACYATDWYQTCALYCDQEHDCDKETIQFRVVGQKLLEH